MPRRPKASIHDIVRLNPVNEIEKIKKKIDDITIPQSCIINTGFSLKVDMEKLMTIYPRLRKQYIKSVYMKNKD